MRAVIQRTTSASVEVEGKIVGEIERGLVVFLGIEEGDNELDLIYICDKVTGLRVFDDENEIPNRSVQDIGGSILLISQFTLCGDCRHGRRPSWVRAAEPGFANSMYEKFISAARAKGVRTETGVFQAVMKVEICNDGPVTLMIDSRE